MLIIFLKELSETMKFQSFVYGFLQSYNPIDLFKIPLTFTEEFLSIISHKNEVLNNKSYKINYFDLIESLYNIYKKTEKKLNFDVIIFNYFKLNKNKFDREIYDHSRTKYFNNNNNLIKFVNKMNNNNNGNQRILLYQTYELDDSLLLKYIHLNQNMNEKELNSSIYGTFFVKENKLDVIDVNEIETRIEQYCINERLLTTSDICCANLILLFVISLKFLKSAKEILDCPTFLCYLFQEFTIFRKYYSILLNMIYKLFDNKNNINAAFCYYPCINSIRNKRLVPNEELLNIINELNQSDIPNLSNPEEEEEKEIDINDESIKYKIEKIDKLSNYLYVYNNFTPDRFVKEEEILREINMIKVPEKLEVILKTSHLFEPFPPEMANDSAFFDRMHYYLPGWEIPKMRPELITDDYGFITDYLSSYFREMRKETYSDALDKYFRLGNNLNQRDVIAVRKTVSGLIKLIYPNGEYTKEELEEILAYSLIGRRRVKEQLKKIGGMEFYDVHFSYIDKDTIEEKFISVPESGGGKLIPDGQLKAGHTYFIGRGSTGMIGTFKIEVESPKGHGKYNITGIGSDRETKTTIIYCT